MKLLLDTGVLGQICHPRRHLDVRVWLRRAVRDHTFLVSELADYELRRELLRLGSARLEHIRRTPQVALLIDHYDEDWTLLWYILVRG